jgi:major type 1 subunit fimbrin (pilin)
MNSTHSIFLPMRFMRYAIAAMLLALFSTGSWAAWCTSGGGGVTLTLPSSIAVPRDTPAGTAITGWVTSGQVTNWYVGCGTSTSATGIAFQPVGLTDTGLTYTESGVTYNLYATGVQGVGMAISGYTWTNANCAAANTWFGPGNVSPSGGTTFGQSTKPPAGWSGGGCASFSQGGGNLGGQILVKLVTTGAQIVSGNTSSGVLIRGASYYNAAINTGNAYVNFTVTAATITSLSCTTPNVTVPMGTHKTTELSGVGTYTASTNFNISLNNCPAGMNSIQYYISPSTTIVNSANSVVALNSGSGAATGIGLQLLNGSGTPFPLNTAATFSGYSTSAGGSYTIPMQARYYQTAATVTAGTANATMTLYMTYQ